MCQIATVSLRAISTLAPRCFPSREKGEVAASAAHKGEVNEGYSG